MSVGLRTESFLTNRGGNLYTDTRPVDDDFSDEELTMTPETWKFAKDLCCGPVHGTKEKVTRVAMCTGFGALAGAGLGAMGGGVGAAPGAAIGAIAGFSFGFCTIL